MKHQIKEISDFNIEIPAYICPRTEVSKAFYKTKKEGEKLLPFFRLSKKSVNRKQVVINSDFKKILRLTKLK